MLLVSGRTSGRPDWKVSDGSEANASACDAWASLCKKGSNAGAPKNCWSVESPCACLCRLAVWPPRPPLLGVLRRGAPDPLGQVAMEDESRGFATLLEGRRAALAEVTDWDGDCALDLLVGVKTAQ